MQPPMTKRLGRLAGALATALAVLAWGASAASARDATVTSFDGTTIALHFFPAAPLAAGA